MKLISESSVLSGSVDIPASKSHTIRALIIATLAEGTSTIFSPLESADTLACVEACRAMGAEIESVDEGWRVRGVGCPPAEPKGEIDVQNSGTSLYFLMSALALGTGRAVITGDEQIQRRSAQPLIDALNDLGATVEAKGANGCAPIVIRGPLKGGKTRLACPTSQYLSSLLIACPLAEEDTDIEVTQLNEAPYVDITLEWLNRQSMEYYREGMQRFQIIGGQAYEPFQERIGGDFSSATFFMVAAAVTGSRLTLGGLNMNDAQGDKAVVDMLSEMGVDVKIEPNAITVEGTGLIGAELDLNATPDALPAMAVAACFAEGTTRLVNVPQARIKETDRIAVMCKELTALGGKVRELEDGLVIEGGGLKGGKAHGHGDHRVVMSLAVAGLASREPVEVDTADAVAVTFPTFTDLMRACGAAMRAED